MKKLILILFLIILIFAATIKIPESITGFFLKATSTILEIIKAVAKQVLTFIASKL